MALEKHFRGEHTAEAERQKREAAEIARRKQETEEAARLKREAEDAARRKRESEAAREGTRTVKWHAICAVVLTGSVFYLFVFRPALQPVGTLISFAALFVIFVLYILVRRYPLSHGPIGSVATHNLDNIISALPALIALCAILVGVVRFWPLSGFNLVIAVMTLLVAIYDLWVIGGAAAKINRLTDEYKMVQ
jgi:cation transport ATPase